MPLIRQSACTKAAQDFAKELTRTTGALLASRCSRGKIVAHNKNQDRSGAADCRAESSCRRNEAETPSGSTKAFQAKISEIETNVNQTNCVRLLVADDAPIIRKAIKRLLAEDPSIEVLGEAESFKQAISMATSLKPDLILLDLHMPDDAAYKPIVVKNRLSVCGSRVVAMSLAGEEDVESRKLAEGFGAVAMLDKAKMYDVLIPTIWKISRSENHDP